MNFGHEGVRFNKWIKLSLYETELDEIDENLTNHLATVRESDLLTDD